MRLTKAQIAGSDPVILAAPTGLAAKQIAGFTIHSIFKVPFAMGHQKGYKKLQDLTLVEMRSTLGYKKYLIVDELSMVCKFVNMY